MQYFDLKDSRRTILNDIQLYVSSKSSLLRYISISLLKIPSKVDRYKKYLTGFTSLKRNS